MKLTEEFISNLRKALNEELPGSSAHQKMMRHRKPLDQLTIEKEGARNSAVLALIYPKKEILHTVFILRPTYSGVHSAQIGFPGGKEEHEDLNLEATALREAYEEVNIMEEELETLGALTPMYIPPSNFFIHPYLAFQPTIPNFIAEEREVAEIIECPIHTLIGEDKLVDTSVEVQGNRMKVKGFQLGERIIWGATAMIVKELAELIEKNIDLTA